MITFNNLTISEDKQTLAINVSIDTSEYPDYYIKTIYVEYYKNRTADGSPSEKAATVYYDDGINHEVSFNGTITAGAIAQSDHTVTTLEAGLFYVIVECETPPYEYTESTQANPQQSDMFDITVNELYVTGPEEENVGFTLDTVSGWLHNYYEGTDGRYTKEEIASMLCSSANNSKIGANEQGEVSCEMLSSNSFRLTVEGESGYDSVFVYAATSLPQNFSIYKVTEVEPDSARDVSLIYDKEAVYKVGMQQIASMTNSRCCKPCENSNLFKQFVLLYHAIGIAEAAGDYDQLDKLWARFVTFVPRIDLTGCNC